MSLILIVDDEPFNIDFLEQELEDLGHETAAATNGQEALDAVAAHPPDMILLDIMMPVMDGFTALQHLKGNESWRDIPVVIISANNDMASVSKGIQLGAEDYLPKPFEPALLAARLAAGLEKKRLRDLEREYLEQVDLVIAAAESVQADSYDPKTIETVLERKDALGNLARVFEKMVAEVHLREQRLKQQLAQLQMDMEDIKRAREEPLSVYLPMDRRQALAAGEALPTQAQGTVLVADLTGFTRLTALFAQELGGQRGAEEMTRLINQVFGALVEEVHFYHGSVIGFSGDALTCWFDASADDAAAAGLRAIACGLNMQVTMTQFTSIYTRLGSLPELFIRVGVASGFVQRYLVGDPAVHHVEAIAGKTLDLVEIAGRVAERGEVVVDKALIGMLEAWIAVSDWRRDPAIDADFGVIDRLLQPVEPFPWPELATQLSDATCRPWLIPAVFEILETSGGEFLSELRPAVAMFVQFGGLDYDRDPLAGQKLDRFVRWLQARVGEDEGTLLQFTLGDKGSYFYVAFGAPTAHPDDSQRALAAARVLSEPPAEFNYVRDLRIGIARGLMRSGGYGSPARRTYGVLGERVNLAAQLMQLSSGIYCDSPFFQSLGGQVPATALDPILVKGTTQPEAIFKLSLSAADPAAVQVEIQSDLDSLDAAPQLVLKIASIAGIRIELGLLYALYPLAEEQENLDLALAELVEQGLLLQLDSTAYQIKRPELRRTAYESMLFAQRRHLHRKSAEWYEARQRDAQTVRALAYHWEFAEESAKAVLFLEQAADQARLNGRLHEAERLLKRSLGLTSGKTNLEKYFYDDIVSGAP
jgi:CheY-like chemotaxis protein/class 3 adenylate cyclase